MSFRNDAVGFINLVGIYSSTLETYPCSIAGGAVVQPC